VGDETWPMAQLLPSRLLRAYEEARNREIKAAADVARGVHGPGEAPSARQQPSLVRALKRREATALATWAEAEGRLLSASEFEAGWKSQGRIGGQENDVYLRGDRAWKRNNLSYHLSYADFFDRLALHNVLFPGARLQLEGFVLATVQLLPVMSQPAVRAKRGARRDEVEPFMLRLGFTRTRGEDYRHPDGILVEDLHDENVFIDREDNLVVVDPVIYLLNNRPNSRPSSPKSRHPSRESLTKKSR
jgi:hypothetical protein